MENHVIDYVSFGIVIDDILLPGAMIMANQLGGGGAQTAWGMAVALGSGESVGLSAVVGADCTPALLAPLIDAGIDLSGLAYTLDATPRAWQHYQEDGSRQHIWRVQPPDGATVYEAAIAALPESYRGAHGFHWGLHPENPTLAQARVFSVTGARVSLETFRPPDQSFTPDALRDLMSVCTVFTPSTWEAAAMVGSNDHDTIVLAFRDAGCQVLALRMGGSGAEIWDFRGGATRGLRLPAVQTRVLDTTGAGNAFAGALLARLDDGIDVAGAAAAAAASFMIEQYGLPSALPMRADFTRRAAYALERVIPLYLA